jgi:hypothetical protein
VNGSALRTPLAGPIGIATAFGSEEDESPPSAAIVKEFRPRADLNRPRRPPCPTSPEDDRSGRFALSEHVLENPQHLPPKEAAHLLALPKDAAISYRGSRMRSKRLPRSRIRVWDRVRPEGRNDQIFLLPEMEKD